MSETPAPLAVPETDLERLRGWADRFEQNSDLFIRNVHGLLRKAASEIESLRSRLTEIQNIATKSEGVIVGESFGALWNLLNEGSEGETNG